MGGLDLCGEAELDLDLPGEAFFLDRDRVQVVLAGLAGVADAQARSFRDFQVRHLAAVLAARRERRLGSPGRLPHRARSLPL